MSSLAPSYCRLAISNLQPFDLIFQTDNSRASRTIRWGDSLCHLVRSPFSHVSIYLGQGRVIEARWKEGVSLRDVSRLIIRRPWIRVLRPVDFVPDEEKYASMVADYRVVGLLYLFAQYDLLGMILSAAHLAARNRKYICSELVSRIFGILGFQPRYHDWVGWSLVVLAHAPTMIRWDARVRVRTLYRIHQQWLGRRLQNITPSMLFHSPSFVPVCNERVVKPISENHWVWGVRSSW